MFIGDLTRAALAFVLLPSAWSQSRPPAASADPGANLPAQKIGANDLLSISVYDAPEFTRTVRVAADGLIRLPMLKQRIRAQGLLPPDLEIAIAAALNSEGILVDPAVTVTVAEYHSRPISVAGAVKSPVIFQAVGEVNLLEAITRAGGLAPEAGPDILVTRTQPGPDGAALSLTRRIAVKSLIDAADPEVNIKLGGGEEIRVPEVGKVFVVGNVKKPGAYPVQDDAESTVLKMLALAEGLTPYAGRRAYIIRRDDHSGHKNQIPIELRKIMERKSDDVPLVANDILYIPDNSGRRATMSALEKLAGFGTATASGIIIWGHK